MDTSITVPETSVVGNAIFTMVVTDDQNVNNLTPTLTVDPVANSAYFEIVGKICFSRKAFAMYHRPLLQAAKHYNA